MRAEMRARAGRAAARFVLLLEKASARRRPGPAPAASPAAPAAAAAAPAVPPLSPITSYNRTSTQLEKFNNVFD